MSADLRPSLLTGPPAGTKATGGQRADFREKLLDLYPVTKGYRVWWSRAAQCPCYSNLVSKQPDPTCSLCGGKGWFYFSPSPGLSEIDKDSAGNPVEINEARDAIGISVIITGTSLDIQIFEKFGEWAFGTAKITAQSKNRIGYRDRFTCRDAVIWGGQLVEADGTDYISVAGGMRETGLWAPAVSVVQLRSLTEVYRENEHFEITKEGQIHWLRNAPDRGTRLSYYGSFHPTWIALEFPFAARDTNITFKKKGATPDKQWTQLPMHTIAKLDFLVQP